VQLQADYDGNILMLANGDTVVVVIKYDDSPYGAIIVASSPTSDPFPLHIHSKCDEPETGLCDCSYRYDTRTAKWLLLALLGEAGDVNITAFCRNDPVNNVDPLGLDPRAYVKLGLTTDEIRAQYHKDAFGNYYKWSEPAGGASIQIPVSPFEGYYGIDPYAASFHAGRVGLQDRVRDPSGKAFSWETMHGEVEARRMAQSVELVGGLATIADGTVEGSFGVFLLLVPEGVISKIGGAYLLADAGDRIQSTVTGKTGFETWLDSLGFSEAQVARTVFIKDAGVFCIMLTGSFSGSYDPVQFRSQGNIGGITPEQAAILHEKLIRIPGARQVRAFGSRTKGTFTSESDLDIAIFGRIDEADPAAIAAVREAQAYARAIGIRNGKGYRPLDVNIYRNPAEMRAAFRANPDFDPSLGVPQLKQLR
jgi:RHS repeat-associated protein